MVKMALLCSGQGAQYVGMGRDLCSAEEIVADTFDQASEALGLDMRHLCFESSNAELARTANTQPAILTYSVALQRLWSQRHGVTPDAVAGHSLGEISALTIAGSLRFEDAVRLARLRGELMQAAVPEGRGLMLAVQTRDHDAIAELCERVAGEKHEVVSISNYNSMKQVVVAGDKGAVMAVHDHLAEQEINGTLLNVSVPFHCSLMEPLVDPLREALEAIDIQDPQVPVLSNVTGRPYEGAGDVIDLLTRQVVSPVRWIDDLRWLRMNGFNYAVEVGPGATLTKFMRHTFSDIRALAYDKEEGRADVARVVERMTYPFVPRALGMAAATRNHSTDTAEYQRGVVQPVQQMRQIANRVQAEDRAATAEEVSTVLELLLQVFRTKGVPQEEQDDRIRELVRDTRTDGVLAGVVGTHP